MGKYATEGRKISTLPKIENITGKFVVQTENVYKLVDVNTVKNLVNGIELIVNIPTGSSVSVSDGEQTISKTAVNNTVEFSLPYFATWAIVATLDNDTVQKTINVTEVRVYEVNLRYEHIYGIRRDQNSSSPEWTRTDDAVGLTATPSIGSISGSSDFDDCYPWKDMKRVTLSVNTNGIQKMVWIPEFWYKREVNSEGIEAIQICDKATTGFTKHPGSGLYVGAYRYSSGGKSINGTSVQNGMSLAAYKSDVVTKNGAGWYLYNIAIWSALQMLYLVEYANNNAQSVIGSGLVHGYSVTGSTDNISGLTGRPEGTDGYTDVMYRGVEGLWGGYAEFIDGINIYDGTYYVCTNPTDFAVDTASGYTTVSYTGPGGVLPYITKTGYDPNVSWCMLPSEASGGSASTYYCDATYIISGWRSLLVGGYYGYNYACGMFFCYGHKASDAGDEGFTSRIAYYPELDPEHNTIIYTDLGGES